MSQNEYAGYIRRVENERDFMYLIWLKIMNSEDEEFSMQYHIFDH